MNAEKMAIRLKDKLLKQRVVDETTGCWLWTGAISSNGYGVVSYQRRFRGVHRVSAHFWLGLENLNSPLQANHKRECPNKHCFNPEHLYVGDQSQNLHDHYGPIEERICPKGHQIANPYIWKSPDGKVYRWCRICVNIRNRSRFRPLTQ